MPYNPGVNDISGQLRAQGMMRGGEGLLAGLTGGINALQEKREEDKANIASIKAFDTLMKGMEGIAGQLDPKIQQAVQQYGMQINDTTLSNKQRALIAAQGMKGLADVMKIGSDVKQNEQQIKTAILQGEQAKVMAAKVGQENEFLKARNASWGTSLDELSKMDGGFNTDSILKVAAKNKMAQEDVETLLKLVGKRQGAQTYGSLQEAQAAANNLKSISGTVPTIKFENGVYVVETVGRAPGDMDPYEKGRSELFLGQVKQDMERGDAARKVLPSVNRLQQLLESGKVETGTLAKMGNDVRALGKSLNMPVDEGKLADFQEAQAYAGRFFLDSVVQMKGAVSDKETTILQSLGPEPGKDTETNKRLVKMTKDRLDLDQRLESLARQWRQKKLNEGQFEDEREKLIRDYDSKLDKLFPAATGAKVRAEAKKRFSIDKVGS